MEKLCDVIGFTKDMIESLLTKKEVIQCNGKIYSEEHRRKFDIKNDIFRVEKNPTDSGKLMLTMIAAINEFERENLLERQREGIAIAKEQGKFKGGQVKRIDDKTFTEAYERYQRRELTKTQLAAELKISRPTLDKLIKDKGLK